MASHRIDKIDELVKFIDYHTQSLEEQTHYFGMMNALTEVAIDGTFVNQPPLISHYYLRAISEILEKASETNEASIALLRNCMERYLNNE